ncbi:unnamed protein product [Lymnaea stagnalis]|uniref:MYND-type domain-containing protein n=1 Tax=Lymnaea stagnalis TaxID=6523 RepID=A0AAV2H2G4_LYMST
MERGGVEVYYVPFEVLERYQRERRCMNCRRRSFRDMLTCANCREFNYCSIECLEFDRAKHEPECNLISFKKGTAHLMDHNMAMSLDKSHTPSDSQTAGETTRKRRNRKKKNKSKSQLKNKDILEAGNSSSPAQGTVASLAGGNCGGRVVVDDKVRSGTTFGDGWWKPKNEKADKSGKVDDDVMSGAPVKKQQKSRFPEYDTNTDSGDDGSRPAKSAGAAGGLEEIQESNCNNSPTFKIKHNPGSKVNATDDKVKAREQTGSVEDRSAPSTNDPTVKRKGVEGSDTRGQRGSKSEAADTQNKHAQGHQTTPGVKRAPRDKQKAGEAAAATGGSDTKEPKKLEKCFCCRRGSYAMLKCSRCKVARYCNTSCQKKDFPKHKKFCKRAALFKAAVGKLPPRHALEEVKGSGGPRLSTKLEDLSSEFENMPLGGHRSILLQITGPYFHPFRHGVTVMDQVGATSHIMFYDPSDVYLDHGLSFGRPVHLSRCLESGNFILLLDACSHAFLDGTVGIRVDDLQDVHFVFKD